ncbi:MAG: ComEA family DNA-binding protein [Caldilineales bacterium]
MARRARGEEQKQDVADKAASGGARPVLLAVLLTSLLWSGVAAALVLARSPQPVAFAVQPPPATWTPAPTPTQAQATALPVPAASASTTVPQRSPAEIPAAAPAALINLNTADVVALETLPAIGAVTAQAIVDYRNQHGPFRSIEELDNVKGIGAATLEKLRPLVTID